jgi:two-component system, OmpR family, sensor kinase
MKFAAALLRPPGIRYQLSLWYTAVFALLILGSGVVVYKYLEYSLAISQDAALSVRAQELASEITRSGNSVVIHDVSGNVFGSAATQVDTHLTPDKINVSTVVRILDAHGKLVAETPAFSLVNAPAKSITAPLQGSAWQGTVSIRDNLDIRLYSVAVHDRQGPLAIVQVGESLAQIRAILHSVAIILLLLAPVVMLLSALGSSWLASRAFAPIHRLTSTARQIKAGDLHQRVPVPQAHDEVYYLAVTLNEMIERLDEAFQRQRRFVSDASHELRTPVAALRSKAELALMQELTPQEHQAVLQYINVEAERLGHLISDLLALAHIDEGQVHLEREPVQLDVLVGAVAANAELLAQEREITVQVKETNESITVPGDEARLIQVVMNLLDNALIYTRPGGFIQLSIERDGQSAYIIVSDTGEGIATKHLPHIFERFYRADSARMRREGGSSGLGLAIVDWVVRAHGGSIDVKSQLGQGSTFTVSLPLTTTKILAEGGTL